MSEVAPAPVKGGNANNRQKLLLAILATILVAVLFVFLLPTLMGGGDATDTSTADTSVTTAPATGTPAAPGTTGGSASEGETQTAQPVARPARNPFNAPAGFQTP